MTIQPCSAQRSWGAEPSHTQKACRLGCHLTTLTQPPIHATNKAEILLYRDQYM